MGYQKINKKIGNYSATQGTKDTEMDSILLMNFNSKLLIDGIKRYNI